MLVAHAAADPAAQARFHDERAREHFANRRFDQALHEFFLEQRVAPNPRTVYNISLCFVQLKRFDDAFMYLTEYLESEDADEARRSYATSTLEDLKQKTARVQVLSDPPGATIYVGKKELGEYGKTPSVLALPEGTHEISVELAGHAAARTTVTTKLGEQVSVSLQPRLITGELIIKANTPDAELEVRDSKLLEVASGPAPLKVKLPPGSYEVRATADEHSPWTALAVVFADQTSTYSALLPELPSARGELTVTSNVRNAIIKLNGEVAGFAPAVLDDLRPGKHRISVTRQNLLPWEGSVLVKQNERAWLTVSLEEPAQTVRSPWTWISGGVGGAALLTGGVLGTLALLERQSVDELNRPGSEVERADAKRRGVTLATSADVAFATGVVSLGVAAALYFMTEEQVGKPSSATTARGERTVE